MTNDLHDRHVCCTRFIGETPQQVRLAHARFALNKDCCTSTIRSIVESLPKEITFGSAAYGDPRSSVHGHTVMLEVVFDCRQKSASFGIAYLFVVTVDVRRTTMPKTNSNIAMTNRLF